MYDNNHNYPPSLRSSKENRYNRTFYKPISFQANPPLSVNRIIYKEKKIVELKQG